MKKELEQFRRMNTILHDLSQAGILFFILGNVFMIRFFMSSFAGEFKKNDLNLAMVFMGIFMVFISMADARKISPKEEKKIREKYHRAYVYLVLALCGFVLSILLGLFYLLYVRDFSLGVSIATFGLGGVALQKYHLERYTAVLEKAAESRGE